MVGTVNGKFLLSGILPAERLFSFHGNITATTHQETIHDDAHIPRHTD